MKNKKIILVTGGAGFVGSHLCERLSKDKRNRVISLDNYFTGTKKNHVPGVEYRRGHTKDIQRHISEKPSIIYHLGEYSRVAASLYEPELVWDLNVAGTLGVLEFWRHCRCKLVYAGSSTKFAKGRSNDVEGRDLAPYTWGKASNSELVRNYGRWYNLNYSITYFYNVYGPRERAGQFDGSRGTVVGTFKHNYLKGEPCGVRKPGTQTRAFTHVDDTVSGIILAGQKGKKKTYNICGKEVYSLLDITRILGCKAKMLTGTKSSRSSGAMSSRKIKALGWKQTRTLEDYLEAVKQGKEK